MKATLLASHGDNVVHLRTRSPTIGLHVLGEWYGCPRAGPMKRAERLAQVCSQLAREVRFEVVSHAFQQFEPDGVIGVLILSDAHIAIHTWPETGFVAIDVYTCHLTPDTRQRALEFLGKLRDVLRPVWVDTSEINRGVAEPP